MNLSAAATLSYGMAGASFCMLGLMLPTMWSRRRHTALLGLACVTSVLWSVAAAQVAWRGAVGGADLLELCRDAAWSAFLLRLLGYPHRQERVIPLLLGGVYLTLGCASLWPGGGVATASGQLLTSVLATRALLAVVGMVLVEQLYRQKSEAERWAVKYACLGIGAIFAYDFYLYADALLLQAVNPELWAARGLVNALTAPLIGLSMARSAAWPTGLALSRQALFHSAALAGSACYLLAMGAAGYYLRYIGGQWGALMQMAFLSGALLLLAGVLFSGTFRSRLNVLISKHFYRYDYDYREQWLGFTWRLSQRTASPYERAVDAIAHLVDSPGGALWIVRERRAVLAAQCRMTITPGGIAHEVRAYDDADFFHDLESRQWVIDLAAPGPLAGVAVPAWLAALPRARLLVPLIHQEQLLGFVVLQHSRSALRLNWEVLDLLKVAAAQVSSYLALQEAAEALMTARQFESFHRMSTFIVHDLKNLVAQLSLMVPNARQHMHNPAFQRDMLETITHASQKMSLMLQKLHRNDVPQPPETVELAPLLRRTVALWCAATPRPSLQCDVVGLRVMADASMLQRVLGHLLQNAIEASPPDGQVRLRLTAAAAGALVEISDSGAGMSAQFIRERLFKPFDTTKPAGMGVGAFECRSYIVELGGTIEVDSAPEQGATFRVWLPAAAASAPGEASEMGDMAKAASHGEPHG
jgi:putative PEP-CTERM system histidine kinase